MAQRMQQRELVRDEPFGGHGPLWLNLVQHTDVYAEWGTGRSTIFAMKTGCRAVISVDSAQQWLESVGAAVGSDVRFMPILVDLGPVGEWGRPESYRARERFDDYLQAPFRAGLEPGLILIDGRFRVACWANAMLRAIPGTLIVFDDYVGRGHYQVVEEVVPPIAVAGRQAVFSRPAAIDVAQLEQLLQDFRHVMD